MSGPVTDLDRHVGKMLRARRLAKGWSQSELSRRSGITRGVISVIELGTSRVFLSQFVAIAEAFQPTGPKGAR